MIGSLRGRLLDRDAQELLVEVGGVGYRVKVSPSTAVTIGDVGDDVYVEIHHHIREGDQALYGFPTRAERVAFEALIAAHGVGPAMALAILSVHDPASLHSVLANDDIAALCLVPGVGKKTAQRLLVELKSRLDVPDIDLTSSAATTVVPMSPKADVREALVGLGYGADEIHAVIAALPDDEDDAGVLLRSALRSLAGAT